MSEAWKPKQGEKAWIVQWGNAYHVDVVCIGKEKVCWRSGTEDPQIADLKDCYPTESAAYTSCAIHHQRASVASMNEAQKCSAKAGEALKREADTMRLHD